MKKYYILFLTVLFMLLLTGCSNSNGNSNSAENSDSQSSNSTSSETSDIDPDEESVNTEGSNQFLVAYFSQTGNTQLVAEDLSSILNANLFQILPVEPYTQEDIDYNDESRSKTESEDESARPAINGTVEDFDQYKTIFLGYPIWYGQAPKIIDTFLESYDFSGKTIVPFCTSGSSGIEDSLTSLKALAPNATWQEGMRFSTDPTEQEVADWVNSLGINK